MSWLPLACSSQESSRDTAARGAVGELGLALSVASGTTFAVVEYPDRRTAGVHRIRFDRRQVYSDNIAPVTTAVASPASGAVTVALNAVDLRNGMTGDLPGWVDRVHYSSSGAQVQSEQTVNGGATSIAITATGKTTITFFATDAAGNDESPRSLQVVVGDPAPAPSAARRPRRLAVASRNTGDIRGPSGFRYCGRR